jgi:Tfp pilus assembly protein PilX
MCAECTDRMSFVDAASAAQYVAEGEGTLSERSSCDTAAAHGGVANPLCLLRDEELLVQLRLTCEGTSFADEMHWEWLTVRSVCGTTDVRGLPR